MNGTQLARRLCEPRLQMENCKVAARPLFIVHYSLQRQLRSP